MKTVIGVFVIGVTVLLGSAPAMAKCKCICAGTERPGVTSQQQCINTCLHSNQGAGFWSCPGGSPGGGTPPPTCQRSGGVLSWSCAGPIAGRSCERIFEAADPDTWADNYLCWTGSLGLKWSSAGPLPGMTCTRVYEDAEPANHTWNDNFLCAPTTSPYSFEWSQAGPLSGRTCVQWLEPSDPHTWSDNYLCYSRKVGGTDKCAPGVQCPCAPTGCAASAQQCGRICSHQP